MSKKVFFVYRYQILPISSNLQIRLDSNYNSIDELIENKNKILGKIIIDEKANYRGKGYNVISKHEASDGGIHFLRMGVEKMLSIHDKEFKSKTEFDYPNSLVYINNDPEQQLILIEHEFNAFYKPKALKNIIEKTWNLYLKEEGLTAYFSEITEASEFWDTILYYKGKIKALNFTFIRPNMANISGKAVNAIKILKNQSNSHKTTLGLNAPKKGVLENITPENEEISDLVDYQAKGGGNATIRIKGSRKKIKTSKKQVTFEVDEATIENVPFNKVSQVLESFINTMDG
ncbi:hypothetical protein [Maribacter sp. 2308TA10-17]|uniref:hypothetical protein n=1 Tax=Maribacter sp. 2308TA10-17 TaxID=3386276 RepID=UPI0039BCE638